MNVWSNKNAQRNVTSSTVLHILFKALSATLAPIYFKMPTHVRFSKTAFYLRRPNDLGV